MAQDPLKVRFWGTRGSVPTPGPQTAKYGGNTSCVEVRAQDGTIIVLDCGTGARLLGLDLLKSASRPFRINLFIGHTHWDHIQGFPFFTPAFLPDTELNVFAPAGLQRSVEDALAGQMQYSYFPVTLRDLRSRIHFTELEEGFFRLGDAMIETQYLNHTAPTISFRISSGGATVAYVTDHEPFWNSSGSQFKHPGDQRHIAFLNGADLVIHDAQYSLEEYPSKIGWGHSTVDYATEIAMAAGVKQLALFHHDPLHDDHEIARMEGVARHLVKERGAALDVVAAAEGLTLDVQGTRHAQLPDEASAFRRRSLVGERVLVVGATDAEVATIGQVLAEDGLVFLAAPDSQTALIQAGEVPPSLMIVDKQLPQGDGVGLIRQIRSKLNRPNLPALMLTNESDAPSGRILAGPADDYLARPIVSPMLRARVRAWLTRALTACDGQPADEGVHGEASDELPASLEPVSKTLASAYAGLLAAAPLFQSLSQDQVTRLVSKAVERVYLPGQTVFRQGESGAHVYVILGGQVRIVEATPEAPLVDRFVGELGHGEIVGEMGLLLDHSRTATVMAVERTRCLMIPQDDFTQALEQSPPLAIGLLRMMAARLQNVNRLLSRTAPDPLTVLAGRRTFHDQYRRLAAGARRRRSSVILLSLDVLHLKEINDHFGYSMGDEVLRAVADALVESTRTTDLVSRYGPDEFTVLLTDAGHDQVEVIVDRVTQKLADLGQRRALPRKVECSIGIAVSQVPPESAEELLREADLDMNRRKI
ncbi:MAG: diguanylate cyclase [Nitrospirae bacterium]|nr:diguanylate cyclase [Nitrospirota bacterium]